MSNHLTYVRASTKHGDMPGSPGKPRCGSVEMQQIVIYHVQALERTVEISSPECVRIGDIDVILDRPHEEARELIEDAVNVGHWARTEQSESYN